MRELLAALLVVSTAAGAQTFFRWTDQQGEVHYTDDRSTIPAGAKVDTTEGEALTVMPAANPGPIRPSRAGRPAAPPAGPIEVRLTEVKVPVSDGDRALIEEALRAAAGSPRLAAWGGLRESVAVEIAPARKLTGYVGADAFGRAVGTNKVLLRAPKELRLSGRPLNYAGTALHELAHLLEHQLAGQGRPAWFAEGFASFVAEQDRAAAIDDIAWWVIHEGGARPLDTLFGGRCEVHLAYAIARQAVGYLVQLVGEHGLQAMFTLRARGARFGLAFSKIAGFTVDEFQERFIEWLRPSYDERARSAIPVGEAGL